MRESVLWHAGFRLNSQSIDSIQVDSGPLYLIITE